MAKIPEVHEFTIDEYGDVTAERMQGKFSLKLSLTHKEQLRRDELRRLYLGSFNEAAPSPRALNQADILSDINIRIDGAKGCPEWWRQADMGLNLKDDSVLRALNEQLEKGLAERAKAVKDALAEARGELKTLVAEAK